MGLVDKVGFAAIYEVIAFDRVLVGDHVETVKRAVLLQDFFQEAVIVGRDEAGDAQFNKLLVNRAGHGSIDS